MKFSASSLSTAFDCDQLWQYTYEMQLEPVDSGSFESRYGSAFHALLEGNEDPLSHFGPKWRAVIRLHLDSYNKFWEARNTWRLNYLQREAPFEFTLPDGAVIRGFIDGVAEWQGKNYLVETKTTGSKVADFLTYREHALQPAVYLCAARQSVALQHYNVAGIIYDITLRPSIRQKKNEPDEKYIERCGDWFYTNRHEAFHRHLMERSEDYLHDAMSDMQAKIELLSTGNYPKNRNACFKYRKKCGFYGVCFEGLDVKKSELFQPRKKR